MDKEEKEKIKLQVCVENCKHPQDITDDDLRKKCEDCPLNKL